jgi:dihydrodipicolinate synthase/N-acetylneuraminate lyase
MSLWVTSVHIKPEHQRKLVLGHLPICQFLTSRTAWILIKALEHCTQFGASQKKRKPTALLSHGKNSWKFLMAILAQMKIEQADSQNWVLLNT